MKLTCLFVSFFATFPLLASTFSVAPRLQTVQVARQQTSSSLAASTLETETEEKTIRGLTKRDRYVAMNRFAVRAGQNAKFEKRWATRKSRLSQLDGFRYFHLMRRVNLNEDGTATYDEGDSGETAQENYVSFTIWDKKSDFSAWRNGEAFKEAHGGTSIGAFLSTMVNSALVLRGAPRPAFFDGLFTVGVKPKERPVTVDGWRNVEADGITTLPTESFISLEKHFVNPEFFSTYEDMWATRESTISKYDGFVAMSLLRRDGQQKGHGTVPMEPTEANYIVTVVFKDRSSFEAWRKEHEEGVAKKKKMSPPPSNMFLKQPEKLFYEGTLVISSEEGA